MQFTFGGAGILHPGLFGIPGTQNS